MSSEKRNRTFIAIAAVLITGAAGYVIAQNDSESLGMNHGHTSQATPTPTSTVDIGPDAMFFQMMIPHHQQAIDMSTLALTQSENQELKDLAKSIIDAQTKEIEDMQSWLKDAGVSAEGIGHVGHGMTGMLTDEEFNALKNAKGSDFDKLWLQGMIAHHDGAIQMVDMIDNSPVKDTQDFGLNVKSAQTAEIRQMQEMLTKLG